MPKKTKKMTEQEQKTVELIRALRENFTTKQTAESAGINLRTLYSYEKHPHRLKIAEAEAIAAELFRQSKAAHEKYMLASHVTAGILEKQLFENERNKPTSARPGDVA